MPKPQRCRRICRTPKHCHFNADTKHKSDEIYLSLDEFEVIRLVDYEKKTHQECAQQMDISRTTVTEIYERARFKIADYFVNGKTLFITGGNYRLCDGSAQEFCQKKCRKINQQLQLIEKGENIMRIAITYDNGNVFQHFGHCEQFKFYDVENNQIISAQIVNTDGAGHGALATFLSNNKVDVLICGGIGAGAKEALEANGIQLMGGVIGIADTIIKEYLNDTLSYNPDIQCHHHDNEDTHTCGKHDCGNLHN